jgi:hypothetical protein
VRLLVTVCVSLLLSAGATAIAQTAQHQHIWIYALVEPAIDRTGPEFRGKLRNGISSIGFSHGLLNFCTVEG